MAFSYPEVAFASKVLDKQKKPRRYYNQKDNVWHVQLVQGDFYVTQKRNEVLTTVLGSCVAACIRDPVAGIGGMNHFLLPDGSNDTTNNCHFGRDAMTELIGGLLRLGAKKSQMEAKLFGGANVLAPLADIGARNAEFAKTFLTDAGIRVIGGDVGGFSSRRIMLWPLTGRVRQYAVQTEK